MGRLEPVVGIEPTTHALRKRCSTTELHRLRRRWEERTTHGVVCAKQRDREYD